MSDKIVIQNEKNGGVKFSSIVRIYHQWIEVGRDAGIRNYIQNRHSIVVSRNARRGLQQIPGGKEAYENQDSRY